MQGGIVVGEDGEILELEDDPSVGAAAVGMPFDDRSARWMQTSFDRRASARLAAWAKPEPLAPDEDPELKLPELPTPAEGQAPDPQLAAEREQIEQRRKAREMEILARHVTLGRWVEIGGYLESLPAEAQRPSYLHLLTQLQHAPQTPGQPQMPAPFVEQNDFSFDDLFGLIDAAPERLPSKASSAAQPAAAEPAGAAATAAAGPTPPRRLDAVDKEIAAALAPLFTL